AGRFPQTDVLLQRRRTERSAAPHSAVNEPPPAAFVFDRQLDTRSDAGPIALHSHQPYADPVIAMARVLEQHGRVLVADRRAARFDEDVLVAVVIQVGERYSVAFVQATSTGRGC